MLTNLVTPHKRWLRVIVVGPTGLTDHLAALGRLAAVSACTPWRRREDTPQKLEQAHPATPVPKLEPRVC